MRKTKLQITFLFLFFASSLTYAQMPGFEGDVDDETPAAPIDSLLAFGLLAGTAYGIRKIKK
ncbi:PID-CTERM protein-sorting domain-containing protein [Mesonia sediminis]|uniref:PID-CTERM protein-sorting domain-containing protein n=1 Tax=Mesonia sediminis TaxID=1703946 RepID=A0ABW5S9V3_9FLAO